MSACSGAGRAGLVGYGMKTLPSPELSLAKRSPRMSVIGGRAENICSFRVILSLTRNGKWSFHLVSFGEYHRRNTVSAETSWYLARSNAYSRDDSPPKYESVDNVWSIMPLTVDDDGTVGGRAELNSRAARYRKLARGMIDIATSEKILAFAAELECEAHDSTRP